MRWRMIFGILALILLLPVIVVFSVFVRPAYESMVATKFDSSAWRAGSHIERGRMHDDLLSSHRLNGMYREDVVALLGPPDHESDGHITYEIDLGERFGSSPWLWLLHVEFDEESIVEIAYRHD